MEKSEKIKYIIVLVLIIIFSVLLWFAIKDNSNNELITNIDANRNLIN